MKSMQDIVESIKGRVSAIDAKNAMENGLKWCRQEAVRIVEAAVVACFAVVLVGVGVSAEDAGEGSMADAEAESLVYAGAYSGTAGVAGVLTEYELEYADKIDLLTVVDQDIDVVGSMYADEADDSEAVLDDTESEEQAAGTELSGDDADASEAETQTEDNASENTSEASAESDSSEADSETEEESEEPELTAEEQEWQQYLMADVNEFLYIRAEASEDSETVGKLYKGDRAVIEETSGEWTKISSGSVTGYVKTEYCVTGTEALEYMKANCGMIATVISDKSLRVRKAQSTSSSIIKMVSKGTKLTVDTTAETNDEWVAVIVDGSTCYVYAEFVELSYDIGEAISIEEEKAAEEAAKAAEEAAAEASSSSSSSYDVSDDELTLLAALIQCEAGGESYKCQVSVGAVVMNRVASSRFPNSITKVIYQDGQFGPVSNGSLAKRLTNGVSSTAYKAAQEAIAGTDYTDGCLYFNDIYHTSHSGLQIGAMKFW